MTPRVSICVPAYQAGAHLEETLGSVWRQDFDDFELVVVDDGSTDETAEILAAQADPRLRVFRHRRNRGQARTVSETIARASGPLIKLLDADDLLRHDCVGAMVEALDAHPEAVFAFSRRDVIAEWPDDPSTRRWLAEWGDLQAGAGEMREVNDGRELLRRYLAAGMPGNWIAEPAGVMARRADLLAVGGYPRRVRQNHDMDLWLRLLARGAAVFIDQPLYTYRFALSGVTGRAADGETHWLDRLWMAEGLIGMEGFPEPAALRATRRRLLSAALRRAALSPLREPRMASARIADLAAYGRFRVGRLAGHSERLHEPIGPGPR